MSDNSQEHAVTVGIISTCTHVGVCLTISTEASRLAVELSSGTARHYAAALLLAADEVDRLNEANAAVQDDGGEASDNNKHTMGELNPEPPLNKAKVREHWSDYWSDYFPGSRHSEY